MLFWPQNNPAAHSMTGHPPHKTYLGKLDQVISEDSSSLKYKLYIKGERMILKYNCCNLIWNISLFPRGPYSFNTNTKLK